MRPDCDGNAWAGGGASHGFSATPAFRVRPGAWQPWTHPDGRTVTEAEAGREVTGSFWLCQSDDAAVPHPLSVGDYAQGGETIYYFEFLGNAAYKEEVAPIQGGGGVERNEYHHFVNFRCDRLMFAQNCHVNPDDGELAIPSPRWFAPMRGAGTPVQEGERALRPFNSPASAVEGMGGIYVSKAYADWRLQPKEPERTYKGPAWRTIQTEKRKGIVADEVFRSCILDGENTEDIGGWLGATWGLWDPELLYTVGGSEDGGWYPIYWRESAAAVADNYAEWRVHAGLVGDCDWGEDVPAFMVDPCAGANMLEAIDPRSEGVAFDLCILFRTYVYKTSRFLRQGGRKYREDIEGGYFNTHCKVRARVVAPCPPA